MLNNIVNNAALTRNNQYSMNVCILHVVDLYRELKTTHETYKTY